MDEKELQEYLHNMGQKERRELTARLRLVKPKRKKHTYRVFRSSSACSLRQNRLPEGLKVVHLRLICFCVAAAFHPEQGYAFSTGISACRRMTNGGSGTKPPQIEGYKPARLLPRMRATSYLSSTALASQSLKDLSHCSVVGLPNMSSITTTK